MSRSVPWRSKPSPFILEMIAAAKDYKLYLVNETGPFSFVFRDEADNKFKVSISSTLKCSCGVVHNDHCIHTIFVLLKRFKVDENNPMIWQASYTDSQLEGFLTFKYTKATKPPLATHSRRNNFKKKQLDEDSEEMEEINGDETCPICYMELREECFSTCSQCKNHLHTKCFKIWIKHKLESNDRVTCPLCRNHFLNPMGIVARDLERWDKKFTVHKGTKCQGCGLRNIVGEIYHCVACEQCNLCKYCFNANQHTIHDRFLTKTLSKQPWRIAKPRAKTTKKHLQIEKEAESHEPTELEMRQFLTGSILTLREFQSLETNTGLGLNIVGNETRLKNVCKHCSGVGSDEIRRLPCTHTMHSQCLNKLWEAKSYYCPCGEPLLPGYLSAMGIKPKRIETEKTDFKQRREDHNFKLSSKPSIPPPPSEPKKLNHFRVRKSTNEKRPLNGGNQLLLQINNMPIRTRSLFRSNL